MNNIFYQRCIQRNKNMIILVTGMTGSGKSWVCLRVAELWYKKRFHKAFPMENVCFTLDQIMDRLVNGNLNSGDLIIFEEAGASMGNLDFQNKASKVFNYILQTFRYRNIILLMNLPYFTMLNKTTRMLAHMRWEMMTIDKTKKVSFIKTYWIQVSQEKGKFYFKFPQVMIGGSMEQIRFLNYNPPSPDTVERYEKTRREWHTQFQVDSYITIKQQKDKQKNALNPKPLTPKQQKVWDLLTEGGTKKKQKDVAQILGIDTGQVCNIVKSIKKKGFNPDNPLLPTKLKEVSNSPLP